MKTLSTTFAGLALKNPIIAASSSNTNNPSHNLALEEAGVGAIVLKSLFEEDIIRQCESLQDEADHTEAADYLEQYLRSDALSKYVSLIEESKKLCSVPIIASINCFSAGDWVEFATLVERAGADALELNIMSIVSDANYTDGTLEESYVDIVKAVVAKTSIPVIVKLGSNLSNPCAMTSRLMAHGAKAVVMFNRMFQPDIDIQKMEYCPGHILSSEQDLALPLRWVAITSAAVKQIDVALSGGVQDGKDVIKAILAGASAVEVCSALYRSGNSWIAQALEDIAQWQESKGYDSIDEIRGMMAAKSDEQKNKLSRTQFVKHFGSFK